MIQQFRFLEFIERNPKHKLKKINAYHPMFTAALFKIAKIWKQPKCLLISKWINKMWYVYTMEYYSAIERMKSCRSQNMDGPRRYCGK